MELTLKQTGTQILVICDGQPSHTFDVSPLFLQPQDQEQLLIDPTPYGKRIYAALFPPQSAARLALYATPDRLVYILEGEGLDALPWEYAYGPFGDEKINNGEEFLALKCPIVRGLPTEYRLAAIPELGAFHLIAIPSQPLDHNLPLLAIEEEWIRLKETIEDVPYTILLERTRPPTLDRVRQMVTHPQQKHHILHFMGHGGQDDQHGAVLYLEKEHGELAMVAAEQFLQKVQGTTFLITLNACVSATPGPNSFSNLAASLVRRKTPYALGMRVSILDEEARLFSRTFYSDLIRGSSVEEALFQTRLTLKAASSRLGVIGVPVLYTSLAQPAPGFQCYEGTPTIKEYQPPIDLSALSPIQGAFQGRIDELLALGKVLTGDRRPHLLTIHGSGGQGKTALARVAAERYAFAWPGGVWAISLENLPTRADFVSRLAQFLGINTQETVDLQAIEQQVLSRLAKRRTLIILDNMETVLEVVERVHSAASEEQDEHNALIAYDSAIYTNTFALIEWLKQLTMLNISLLVTSRNLLQWSEEEFLELKGLSPKEGSRLFRQCSPKRMYEIDPQLTQELSQKLGGHPLSIRLLAGAFNADNNLTISELIETYETCLHEAQDKWANPSHRHRSLNVCIEMSVRYLGEKERALLSGLWIFRAPFNVTCVSVIFDPYAQEVALPQETDKYPEEFRVLLDTLSLRSILTLEINTTRRGTSRFYSILPTMRLFIKHNIEQTYDQHTILNRFSQFYLLQIDRLFFGLDYDPLATVMATQMYDDLARISDYQNNELPGTFFYRWGWILYHLGHSKQALTYLEYAIELTEKYDINTTLEVYNMLSTVYNTVGKFRESLSIMESIFPRSQKMGNPKRTANTYNNLALAYKNLDRQQDALTLYRQALSIIREVGDPETEGTILNNIAVILSDMKKPQEAVPLLEQALSLVRKTENLKAEARTLNNLGFATSTMGKPYEALTFYQQALPIRKEIGDLAGEGITYHDMALICKEINKLPEAVLLFQRALSIHREVGNLKWEAITLGDLADVYSIMKNPHEALALRQKELLISREIGDSANEVATLIVMSYLYQNIQNYEEALSTIEKSVQLARIIYNEDMEVTGLFGLAVLLAQDFHRPHDAIHHLERAISIQRKKTIKQSIPHEFLYQTITAMYSYEIGYERDTSIMPRSLLQQICGKTIAVLTEYQEYRPTVHATLVDALQHVQEADWLMEADFLTAQIALLDGLLPTLHPNHPYANALSTIQERIATWKQAQQAITHEEN